jgi:hypothetical protein
MPSTTLERPAVPSALTGRWAEMFDLLVGYAAREGHARVPIAHREAGAALGQWVARQRSASRRGTLRTSRRSALETVPGWVWDAWDAQWNEMFDLLVGYAAREGHTAVPANHIEADVALGAWIAGQRQAHRDGSLTAARSARLSALPGWEWEPFNARWDSRFDLLVAFAQREGHTAVPQKHVENGFALGKWVSEQRRRHHAGSLSPERADRLADLPGWVWDAEIVAAVA